jgi:hypothetical protein
VPHHEPCRLPCLSDPDIRDRYHAWAQQFQLQVLETVLKTKETIASTWDAIAAVDRILACK